MLATGAMQIVSSAATSRFTRFGAPARRRSLLDGRAGRAVGVGAVLAGDRVQRQVVATVDVDVQQPRGPADQDARAGRRRCGPTRGRRGRRCAPPEIVAQPAAVASAMETNRELDDLNCAKHFESPFSRRLQGKRRASRKSGRETRRRARARARSGRTTCSGGVGQIVVSGASTRPVVLSRPRDGRTFEILRARTGAHRLAA